MDRLVAIARWLITLTLLPFLLLSNLHILFSPAFINYEYSKGSWPLPPRYTDEERREVAQATLYYLRSAEDVSYLRGLTDERGPLYNERELKHLVDVKVVARRAFHIHGLLLVLMGVAVAFLILYPPGRRALPASLLRGSLLTWFLLALLGLFAATSFDAFFVRFHHIFFEGNSWLFNPYDTLIQLFPLPFWFDATLTWVGLTLAETAILGAGAYVVGKRVGGDKFTS